MNFPIPQNVTYDNFKGIRTRNGVNTGGQISAIVCQNIDFEPNPVNASVSISSSFGNIKRAQIQGFKVVKAFETIQDGVRHCMAYCENGTKGVLYEVDLQLDTFTLKVDNLRLTGQANGITMNDNAYDIFIFTNGLDYYSINFVKGEILKLEPTYEGEPVTGLAMCEQAGSLVIGSLKQGIVIASRKGNVQDWDYVKPADDKTKPWYQLFGKGVTALVPYIDGLLVFTADDSTLLSGNLSSLDFKRSDASLGGCMSFESWCYHDKYLFFYDNTQKNIYYYLQNNVGQKVLGEPIAPEVQKFFDNIERLQMVSYVGNNRSEIWLLSEDFKLVYDYFIGEWAERVCQELTSYFVFDGDLYSTTNEGKILKEKTSESIGSFDGVFYPSVYSTQIIDLGSYSNMKEMEMRPIFTVTQEYNNVFTLDCKIDGKKTKTKHIEMYFKGGVWGDDTDPEIIPPEQKWDTAILCGSDENITQQVEGKFIPNWYYLNFTIHTDELGEDFNIVRFELKGITQETDTTGRK